MKSLLTIADLTIEDVEGIFILAQDLKSGRLPDLSGSTCAYSFEGSSLRTRATFLKALADLEIQAIELPGMLKTKEDKRHLAGYLDQWIDLYIIRESDHAVLEQFARASKRPLINAMSSLEHPCEVLSDAYSLWERFGRLRGLKFCMVGPPTNVLASWAAFCDLFDLDYCQVAPAGLLNSGRAVDSLEAGLRGANVVLTDAWPGESFDPAYQVDLAGLETAAADAIVIPCPPFDAGREVAAEVIASPYFAGYEQKAGLYLIHTALIVRLFAQAGEME